MLYVALDADAAGVAAAGRIAKNVPEGLRMDVRAVEMPLDVAKDPDEWFNKAGRTPAEYEALLSKAVPIFLFCADHMIDAEARAIGEALAEGDDGALRDARLAADAKVTDFMARSWSKIDVDQRRAIADSYIRRTRTSETYDDLLARWRAEAANAAQGRRQQHDPRDASAMAMDPLRPTFSSSKSRDEDMLIGALYYDPNGARAAARRRRDDVMGAFTSPVRAEIFGKLERVIAEGRDPKGVQDELDDAGLRELSRIITSPAVRDRRDSIGEETVDMVCDELERKHLVGLIEEASNSADLDFDRIFELQDRLNEVEGRIAARKA